MLTEYSGKLTMNIECGQDANTQYELSTQITQTLCIIAFQEKGQRKYFVKE